MVKQTDHVPVLFRRYPDMAVTPLTKTSEFLHLGMLLRSAILYWQASRIEDSNITSQAEEDTSTFQSQEAR